MPKIAVEIKWDWPDEPEWLNADNVALALHAHCKNTKFVVRDVEVSDYDSLIQRLPERVVSEVHQAIGQASMCWEHLDSAGVFDTERAIAIGSDLCNFIADFLENK